MQEKRRGPKENAWETPPLTTERKKRSEEVEG